MKTGTRKAKMVKTKWLMLLITCAMFTGLWAGCSASQPTRTPEEVVLAFYRWYIGYPGNALADGAYHDSGYLTEDLAQEIDATVAAFAGQGGGFDPVLCAQDIPSDFRVEDVTVEGERASAVVYTSFAGHSLGIDLALVDGEWRIAHIGCRMPEVVVPPSPQPGPATLGPLEVVSAFYDWYTGYTGNPLIDGAYRTSEHLAGSLVQEIDRVVASPERGGFDPILCAQDVPGAFTVDLAAMTEGEAEVVVRETWSAGTPARELSVRLARLDGRWQMVAIACPADGADQAVDVAPTPAAGSLRVAEVGPEQTAGWQVLQDETYGFQLGYPAGWLLEEVPLRNPDLDRPMVRVVGLKPAGWREMYLPLFVEVSLGTETDFRRVYPAPVEIERLSVNGVTFTVERPGYGEVIYVLTHPTNGDLRVVLRDLVSEFPERVAGNEEVIAAVLPILSTLRFE